jgi:phosphoglycolate phosphatase
MANLSGCTIAFDLDGTLAETAGDMHTALNHVLVAEVCPRTLLDVRNFVGAGARALIIRAFGVHSIHHDDARLDQLTEAYIAHALDIATHSRLSGLSSFGKTLPSPRSVQQTN